MCSCKILVVFLFANALNVVNSLCNITWNGNIEIKYIMHNYNMQQITMAKNTYTKRCYWQN